MQQKKYLPQATIISILILNDKMVISLCYKDQTLWQIYIIIANLDAKNRQSQKLPGILLLGFILVYHERSKDIITKRSERQHLLYGIKDSMTMHLS